MADCEFLHSFEIFHFLINTTFGVHYKIKKKKKKFFPSKLKEKSEVLLRKCDADLWCLSGPRCQHTHIVVIFNPLLCCCKIKKIVLMNILPDGK